MRYSPDRQYVHTALSFYNFVFLTSVFVSVLIQKKIKVFYFKSHWLFYSGDIGQIRDFDWGLRTRLRNTYTCTARLSVKKTY